jgi:hypothetical protein
VIKITGWPGFKYTPVLAVVERLQARQARTERKNFLKFLRGASSTATDFGRTCMDLAHRVRRIHDSKNLTRDQKQSQFAAVLETYSEAVMESARQRAKESSEEAAQSATREGANE